MDFKLIPNNRISISEAVSKEIIQFYGCCSVNHIMTELYYMVEFNAYYSAVLIITMLEVVQRKIVFAWV